MYDGKKFRIKYSSAVYGLKKDNDYYIVTCGTRTSDKYKEQLVNDAFEYGVWVQVKNDRVERMCS